MKKRRWAIIRVLSVVFLLMCLVLPASIAYAETPEHFSTVLASVSSDGIGSPFQHHTFTDTGINWVFYLDNLSNTIEGMWSDNGVTWAAIAPIRFCNGSTAGTVGGQFDTWYDPTLNYVHFAVVNTSTVNSPILYGKYTVNATAHTLTQSGSWVTAVAANASYWYRNPVICVNNNGQPFITYTKQTGLLTDADVYVITTNNSSSSTWVAEAGMPMHNLSQTVNFTEYGSVIPYWDETKNVSVQYVYYNGSACKLYQTDIEWNGSSWNEEGGVIVDTSDWYLPSGYEWDYNAVSIDSVANDNDIAIQCLQTNGTDTRTFFNRKGVDDAPSQWDSTYARNFGEGDTDKYLKTGAMSIRDTSGNLVYSGWNELDDWIESNDYDLATGYWDGIQEVYEDNIYIPYWSAMADYQYDWFGTGDVGFIYGSITTDTLRYGLYGPTTPATVPTSVDMMAWIVVLVFATFVCLILLAYGASEAIKGNGVEFLKVALIGLITLVIAATIVAELL